MAYKCKICGVNEVSEPDGVCEYCAVSQDPYLEAANRKRASVRPVILESPDGERPDGTNSVASRASGRSRRILVDGGAALSNAGPYENAPDTPDDASTVRIYQPGQSPEPSPSPSAPSTSASAPVSGKLPLTSGISKNIQVDTLNRGFLEKCFLAVFQNIPYLLDNRITMFQVFPDYSGTALNAQGNACDQVIVYGTLNAGAVSENNEVDVFGRRDAQNNVIATEIRNKASGAIIRPSHAIPAAVVRVLLFSLLAAVFSVLFALGVSGVVYIAVLAFCLLNLPFVIKALGALLSVFISLIKQIFR